jgi:hypothetical protein
MTARWRHRLSRQTAVTRRCADRIRPRARAGRGGPSPAPVREYCPRREAAGRGDRGRPWRLTDGGKDPPEGSGVSDEGDEAHVRPAAGAGGRERREQPSQQHRPARAGGGAHAWPRGGGRHGDRGGWIQVRGSITPGSDRRRTQGRVGCQNAVVMLAVQPRWRDEARAIPSANPHRGIGREAAVGPGGNLGARISRTSSRSTRPLRESQRSTRWRTCARMVALACGVSSGAGRKRTASQTPERSSAPANNTSSMLGAGKCGSWRRRTQERLRALAADRHRSRRARPRLCGARLGERAPGRECPVECSGGGYARDSALIGRDRDHSGGRGGACEGRGDWHATLALRISVAALSLPEMLILRKVIRRPTLAWFASVGRRLPSPRWVGASI